MMSDSRGVVLFVLSDAARIGYQLRMNIGGLYLDQLRLAAAMLAERAATADGQPGPLGP